MIENKLVYNSDYTKIWISIILASSIFIISVMINVVLDIISNDYILIFVWLAIIAYSTEYLKKHVVSSSKWIIEDDIIRVYSIFFVSRYEFEWNKITKITVDKIVAENRSVLGLYIEHNGLEYEVPIYHLKLVDKMISDIKLYSDKYGIEYRDNRHLTVLDI